jgi:hypothetical protein
MRRRKLLGGAIVGGGAALAFFLPAALGLPAWVPFLSVLVAFVALGAVYDRIVRS